MFGQKPSLLIELRSWHLKEILRNLSYQERQINWKINYVHAGMGYLTKVQ